MVAKTGQVSSFVIVGERREDLFPILRSAFSHDWIASYQIGFGPPLVKSSERIVARVKAAKTALEKLAAYVDVCLLDETERVRLTALHRRLVIRRSGPVEAESLDAASADALDLSLRIHIPYCAPPKVAGEMERAGVDFTMIPADTPPDVMDARFFVRLSDPTNRRLLHIADVGSLVRDRENGAAVELRVPVTLRPLWATWLTRYSADTGHRFVDLEEPASHARVLRDGEAI
jgi:hypothetical protein